MLWFAPMQRPLPPSPQLLAEFLLWREALARTYPAGPQAWFEDCVERWFLALVELGPQGSVAEVLAKGMAG